MTDKNRVRAAEDADSRPSPDLGADSAGERGALPPRITVVSGDGTEAADLVARLNEGGYAARAVSVSEWCGAVEGCRGAHRSRAGGSGTRRR